MSKRVSECDDANSRFVEQSAKSTYIDIYMMVHLEIWRSLESERHEDFP